MYRPKTKPFPHQSKARKKSRDLKQNEPVEYFGYLCEQGTGKTKLAIDDIAELYELGRIGAAIVFAPSDGDVPENWVDQFKVHLPDRIPYVAHRLEAKKPNKAEAHIQDIIFNGDTKDLRIICTNAEMARRGSRFFPTLLKMMRRVNTIVILDEATDYESMAAEQTKGALKLGANAPYRRILAGVIGSQGPFKVYSIMKFLHADILGFDSFTAYKAHYCEMLADNNPLVRSIASKKAMNIRDPIARESFIKKMSSVMAIPAKNANGTPRYKNLEELRQRTEPFVYRVLKKDIGLPPKLYAPMLYVELTPKQREIYDTVKNEVIAEFVHLGKIRVMTPQMQMIRLLRLQQIVGNHYMEDPDPDVPRRDRRVQRIEPADHPRILVLDSIIRYAEPTAKGIVWCRFRAEIDEIVERLRKAHGDRKVVEMHGGLANEDRVISRKRFMDPNDEAQWIVVQSSASKGYELTTASWEFFYSNSYSLLDRLQAEDRPDRINRAKGHNLTIHDVMAKRTQDVKIVGSLRDKLDIATVIMGDPIRNWI